MTEKEILRIAMMQSATDSNCCVDDFNRADNVVVLSAKCANARRYLELPFACDLTSYGNNIVASVDAELTDIVNEYISKYSVEHCFETPNLHFLMDKLRPLGVNVCFMAEYFLPTSPMLSVECSYETRVLQPCDFEGLYLPQWSNALCETRKYFDKLAVGAYHDGMLIGLAGCSADSDAMWQIGIDVLPEFRRQGIASALTNKLARLVLSKGIVPFYCSAWSNIKSVRNAIKSGFLPAWVQLTVKPSGFIDKLNK